MKLSRTTASYLAILFLLVLVSHIGAGASSNGDVKDTSNLLSIKVKAKSLVLGPEVTLGDISSLHLGEGQSNEALNSIKIMKAPPPGESTDVSMSEIKRKLKIAGFEKYIPFLKGPRTVRIITAHNEIDKAFLKEGLA